MPIKPSEKEEEYIARQEFERLKKIEEEKHRSLAGEEKKNLKELHLFRNSITNLKGLKNLTQLEVLDLQSNPINDRSGLENLKNMKWKFV